MFVVLELLVIRTLILLYKTIEIFKSFVTGLTQAKTKTKEFI